ncbi:type II secretion system minor pseudopilin GspK [Candidatus Enterovibrio altilux]|uniref:Type II secretion system protein K n=1 Tax=Candidatus Enterovibrio altilux TaxID=1927128 RepID=A0A291B907_9GAMM|nr:type II secretion system minor pseudopilin GspK [Candidatus Enterovibrio luxaltus]ATF09484.1 General secretion pathway protein K [Candidatus Enterovibrio luxaltus]
MRRSQLGVALLIVLLMMALMTTVAVSMSSRMFMNFHRTENFLHYQQAYWYAWSVESLARYSIAKNIKNKETVTLHLPWTVQNKIYQLDDGQATSSISDRQACFNLNGLRDIKPQKNDTNPLLVTVLQQLIESQGINSFEAETAAASTWEYIDTNTNVQSPLGVEDSEYETRSLAHITPNNFIADISEWRAINGVSQEIFEKVSPFLCAIPSNALLINVNTLTEMDAPILSAIFYPNLNNHKAKRLINERNAIHGWKNIVSFMDEPILSNIKKEDRKRVQNFFAVHSRFFELDTMITIDSATLRMRALLIRDDNGTVTVIRRRFGGINA